METSRRLSQLRQKAEGAYVSAYGAIRAHASKFQANQDIIQSSMRKTMQRQDGGSNTLAAILNVYERYNARMPDYKDMIGGLNDARIKADMIGGNLEKLINALASSKSCKETEQLLQTALDAIMKKIEQMQAIEIAITAIPTDSGLEEALREAEKEQAQEEQNEQKKQEEQKEQKKQEEKTEPVRENQEPEKDGKPSLLGSLVEENKGGYSPVKPVHDIFISQNEEWW